MKSLLLALPLLINQCSGVDYWSEPPPPVWEQVYEDVRDLATDRHRPGQEIDLRVAPDFPADRLDAVMGLYEEAIGFWSGAFDFDVALPLTVMDSGDRDWWESTTTRGPRDLFAPHWWKNSVRSGGTVGMVDTDETGMPHVIVASGSKTDFEYLGAFSAALISRHEATHWYQYQASGWMTDKCSNPNWETVLAWENWSMPCPWALLPCWFIEGHAELYTIPFGSEPGSLRGLRIWQITNSDRLTESDLLKRLHRTQHNSVTKNPECTRDVQYSVGLLVNEKLFYDFGDAKVNELWLAINQPSSSTRSAWNVAFSDTFGMTAEDWYTTSAIPYLLGVFKN
jgi:hypothetical protein